MDIFYLQALQAPFVSWTQEMNVQAIPVSMTLFASIDLVTMLASVHLLGMGRTVMCMTHRRGADWDAIQTG